MRTETHAPATPVNVTPPVYDDHMLDSDFIRSLRAQFFDEEDKPTWPGDPDTTRASRALTEIPAALAALFSALEPPIQSLPNAPLATALGRVKKAADNAQWPGAGSKIPADWESDAATYRRFEIAWAVNIMMEAYTRTGGGGGGPSDWPSGGHH